MQSEKAWAPIEVTEEGIVMFVKPVQSKKDCMPIVVTEEGITVFLQPVNSVLDGVSMMALQLSRES